MADIDATKNVYLFTHGRQDLVEKSTNVLTENGFSKDKNSHGSSKQGW